MANLNNSSLRKLATPKITYQSLCVKYLEVNVAFKLKFGLIHLLPKFHGHIGEDLYKHLNEFHVACLTMKPQGVSKEHIKLKAFSSFLVDTIKD